MKKIIYVICACGVLFASCVKTRMCECKNSNGTYPSGEVDATKIRAKKLCKDLSTNTTECYLK